MNTKRKRIALISITAAVAVCCIIALVYGKKMLLEPNFTLNQDTRPFIYIRKGDKISDIIEQLQEKNMLINPSKLHIAAKLKQISETTELNPGCYRVESDMNSLQLLSKIQRGEQTPQKLILNNLRLPSQFAQKVSEQLMVDSATVYRYITDTAKMNALGFPPEHLFVMVIANTYEMWWTTPINALMKRLKTESDKFWARNDRDSLASLIGLSRAEVITLASIVDEETNNVAEKRRIAGLYLNRLHCGMMLQSDPTVKYAIGDFTLNQILYSHLNTDSPYNTYRYHGLPPGPIRLPQVATIDAVLNAEQHDYLYMCAHENLDGTHRFARSLREHNTNAMRYHRALRTWKQNNKK